MSYEETLTTVRALSEGRIQRDPNAKSNTRQTPVKQKPLFTYPEPPKSSELVALIDKELQTNDLFTQPEIAFRVHSRTSRYGLNVIKTESYTRIKEGVARGEINIIVPGTRSKSATIYRRAKP